jgi:hypothetical protein
MHEVDNHGEPYLKVIVPSLVSSSTSILKLDHYIHPIEQENLFSKLGECQLKQIHELTYHYVSGVAHFKNTENEHIGQSKNGPKLSNNKYILISRLVFNNLEKAKIYEKIVQEDSIVLELPFNHLGRLFEIYITSVNLRIENSQIEKLPLLATYKITITDSNDVIIVNEYSYFHSDLMPENISFSWFLPNNSNKLLE